MNSTRSSLWDNIKGILICLVVLAHFLYEFTYDPIIEIVVYLIYVFHMPAFIFISGHFTHDPPKLRKLVTAFVIFQSAYLIMEFHYLGFIDILSPAYIMWYLAALIVWRLIAKYIPRNNLVILGAFVLSLVTGFIPGVGTKLGLLRILAFFIFFAAGLFVTEENIKSIRKKIKPFFGFVLLALSLCGALASKIVFQYSKNDLLMMEYTSLRMVLGRAVLLSLAFLITVSLIILVPDKKSFISKIGKNSLPIFLLHRFITLVFAEYLIGVEESWIIGVASVVATGLTVILFGNDAVGRFFNELLSGTEAKSIKLRRIVTSVLVSMAGIIFITTSVIAMSAPEVQEGMVLTGGVTTSNVDPYYRLITSEQQERFDNSVRIVFAGDLILLEDQVRLAYDPEPDSYDFSPMFEYTADEISSADFAIGVYEGPSGGEELGYTTSNYGDGKYLRLNFPDEFAYAIADAGFDFVTTSNNHILDSGLDAAYRTNEVLDEAGLMHIGTFMPGVSREEQAVQIVEVSGMRIAILAYTYGSNYYTEDQFFDGEYQNLTGMIVPESSPYYSAAYDMVEADFEYARSLDPDLIIVLPHMGTQFADEADAFQTLWRDNFISMGADIILGDHTHSVQPAFMEEVDGRMTFTAYCPGNYANIYREYDGDASALIEVYIDPDSHEIVGGGVIPMWTTAQADGNYRPIPVWDIMTDEELRQQLTVDDIARVAEVHSHITGVALGEPLTLDMIEEDYLFDEEGFMRRPCDPIEVTGEMEATPFFETVTTAGSVCFMGDSITYGTKNGGVPWYEPMVSYIEGDILNLSFGGWTTQDLINEIDNIPEAEVYVIAIGTNDVRYDDPNLGAVTAEDYVTNIATIEEGIRAVNPDADIWFIAPWISFDGDQVSPLPIEEVTSRRLSYSDALQNFCEQNNDHYIDPNDYIDNVVSRLPQGDYILDWIHPNVRQGVALYTEAVIMTSN